MKFLVLLLLFTGIKRQTKNNQMKNDKQRSGVTQQKTNGE